MCMEFVPCGCKAPDTVSFSKGKHLTATWVRLHLRRKKRKEKKKMVLEINTWNFVSFYKRSVNIMCFLVNSIIHEITALEGDLEISDVLG